MRKRTAFWVGLLILLVFLTGCSYTDAQIKSSVEQENISALFLEDYDQLWIDLEENYPFFPILEEMGIDAASVRDNYRMYVQKTNTLEQFMDVLDRMFGKLQCFAHLSLFHRERYEMMLTGLEEIEGFEPWKAVLHAPVTAKTYASLPMETDEENQKIPSVQCAYYGELDAAYFRFPTMNINAKDRDKDIIRHYLSQLPDVKHIIIDVVGNPGGSSLYWEDVIVRPFGGRWEGNYRIFYQDSPINQQYYGNRELVSISQMDIPAFAARLDAAYYEEIQWSMDFGKPILTRNEKAKRWVLTDGGYSAAESFAGFCKLTGWATLVGNTTNGDGLGGNPLLLPLKNTGLLVYFTTAMAENPDGTLNAQRGITPDYVLLPKDDRTPLELCLNLILEER